jgi:type IV pilus assembly protein PilE
MNMNRHALPSRARGFTLIELMIVLVIIATLATIAYPSYTQYVVRVSREAAQSQLLELANLQEKIYLNSSAYSSTIGGTYNGTAAGGLGTTGKTADGNYTLSVTATSNTFTLSATPISGKISYGDGNLSVTEAGVRAWGSKTW